ncbi:T9SS type A sorting domain-containing protein, partial [Brumimicrobium oceani]
GVTYLASNNVATHTLTNVAGCDSVVTLDLTINNSNTGTDVQVACDSYTWIDGMTYTASNNTATHTLTNAAGCDSLVTLDLTINYSNTGTDTQVACDSYTWIDGMTYTASNNTATHTLTNAAGCDSLVTLDLTINYSNTGTDTQVACDSYTWIDGVTYTASNNTAMHTLINAAGCDSVVTLDLTINYSNTGTDTQVACDSYTWIDGVTYTASNNTAMHTLINAAGCDSVVTLDLTINYSNTGTDVQVACDSYTWIDGMTYTASNNTATHTLTNAAGCDSLVTLDLIINYSNTGTDVITACDSYIWIDGVTYTTSNNTAMHTLTNAAGCDSVVTLDLTINYSNTGVDTQVACVTYTWIDGVTYTSSNNTATYTLTNMANCDSVVTLDLTINSPNTGTDVVTACGSYTWIDGITYSGSNNVATHTLTNAAGCDSVVTLNLTINNAATGTDVITACDNYTWINGLNYVGSNNSATHTILGGAANGCDSIVTLNLTIINSASGTDVITACDSYTWIDGMTYTTSNSSAMHTILGGAANGCDSIVTLNLTINNATTGIDTQVACETFTWIDGMVYTASNNTATHTIVGGNAMGCDSIVTLDLTIDVANSAGPDVSIPACLNQPVDLDTLVSLGLTGTWLDDMDMPITGTVTLPNTPGSYIYKYVVASGSCPADTAIVTVVIDGSCDYLKLTSEELFDISVYPNPASSVLTILNPSNVSSLKVEMLDMNGRVVLVENKAMNNATEASFAIDDIETGVYTLRVYNNDAQKIFKIVKR